MRRFCNPDNPVRFRVGAPTKIESSKMKIIHGMNSTTFSPTVCIGNSGWLDRESQEAAIEQLLEQNETFCSDEHMEMNRDEARKFIFKRYS